MGRDGDVPADKPRPCPAGAIRGRASGKGESLGADAYELWKEMPADTQNRNAPVRTKKELAEYEKEHLGTMRA